MSVVQMLAAFGGGGLLAGFLIGWLAHARREDQRVRAAQARVEALEGQLALERVRAESLTRTDPSEPAAPAPMLELPNQVAQRPVRTSDSSASRA